MAIIKMTFNEFEEQEHCFDGMRYRARDYVPTEDEFEDEIVPNFAKYHLFLLWILRTGIETESNKAMRRKIQMLVNKELELTDDSCE